MQMPRSTNAIVLIAHLPDATVLMEVQVLTFYSVLALGVLVNYS